MHPPHVLTLQQQRAAAVYVLSTLARFHAEYRNHLLQ